MMSHNEPSSTGTSIMAVEYDGGVVLGADSRTSIGDFVCSGVTDKLARLADKIYCCRSGSAGDTQAITDLVTVTLKYYGHNPRGTVDVLRAATECRNCAYEYRTNLLAGIIVAGWDETLGGQVYNITLGGMMSREPCAIAGSGAPYMRGYADSHYKPGMDSEQCVHLVKTAILMGIRCDSHSGGVVRLGVIDKDGIQRRTFYNTESGEPEVPGDSESFV